MWGIEDVNFEEVMTNCRLALCGCLLVGLVSVASAQENYFDNWPAGVASQEVGKHLAKQFVMSPHQYIKAITTLRSVRGMAR
jgi:hypothetical protein